MGEIAVKNVTEQSIDDLCRVCVSPEMRDDPDWIRGVADKKQWAIEALNKWGPFAKVAYENGGPAGMIQYRPSPEERVVRIDCMYVPVQRCWGKGIGSRLLRSLMEDVQEPMRWFGNRLPLALVIRTFPGGEPGQYTAREFFTRKGFKQIGEDLDDLCYPLKAGFVYKPVPREEARYVPEDEDKGKVLIISGPSFCTATYAFFLKRMERYIREIDPEVPIRWIDSSQEPEEVRGRNVDVGACVVNARLVKSFVLDRDSFQKEVRAALG